MQVFDASGKPLELAASLGQGGEASVYRLAKDSTKALKLYHKPDAEKIRKLHIMLKNPPVDPTRQAGHVSIAWPEALVYDQEARVVGFLMPLLDSKRCLALHQIYNPKTRRQRAPALNWRYLLRIARNLCTVVTALHERGYVIGDLNESNILVSDRALVSLVDCDSVQVKEGRKVYHCPVAKAEYLAPELHHKNLSKVTRTANHDYFSLSVLVFMLLMEGVHPFTGVFQGEGEPADMLTNIAEGNSPYLRGPLKPSAFAPAFRHLPLALRRLFKRAFIRQSWFPRPTAKAWQAALEALESSLLVCRQNPQHLYGRHLRNCPWCERLATVGLEAFPALNLQAAPELKNPESSFGQGFWAFIKRFPLTVLLFLGCSGLLSYGLLGVLGVFALAGQAASLLALGFFVFLLAALALLSGRIKRADTLAKVQRLERVVRILLSTALLLVLLQLVLAEVFVLNVPIVLERLALLFLWLGLSGLLLYLQHSFSDGH